MQLRLLGLCLLLLSGVSFAAGRAPAVEDFVGIEVDQPAATPHGGESLFNLERDIQHIEITQQAGPQRPVSVTSETTSSWGLGAFFAVAFILGLPLFSLLLVMHHLRQKASRESESNIKVLENYRRERELAKQKQDQQRKAS